jgi:glutathione S-transferase
MHTHTHTRTHTQVPMLEIDGLCIVQCEAILRYLARKNDMLGADLAESVCLSLN